MSGEFWKHIQKGLSDRNEKEKQIQLQWERRMAQEAGKNAALEEARRKEKRQREPQIVSSGALLEQILNQVVENDPVIQKYPNRLVHPAAHTNVIDGTIEGIEYRLAIGEFDPQQVLKDTVWMVRPGDKIYTCAFGVYPDGLYYTGRIKPDTEMFYSKLEEEKPIPLVDFTSNPNPYLLGIRDLAVSAHLTGISEQREFLPGINGTHITSYSLRRLPLSKELLKRVSKSK